jgi:putative DNA primase/helicase
MTSERFAEACYRLFGDGLTKSRVGDLEHLFRSTAPDLSSLAHLIAFGDRVWDTRSLSWVTTTPAEDCVYKVKFNPKDGKEKIPFLLELACGDEGVYDDIMQTCAPLVMDKKPTGVIWYLGGGANGKSTLVHLLYLIFGDYLTELTVKQLEDERDTPQLNGKLGNVCKESSEGFVEDTRTYKSIGTHESFSVHKFHSQDMVAIEGNVHHIFSANNIPTFGDKSYGARRRTLVIPFNNRFRPNEQFEDITFTPAFIERFVGELLKYARMLKDQSYEYVFSETTRNMKEKYDTDANTASTYADELVAQDICGFLNFRLLAIDYENWCRDHGYKESSINVLRRAMDDKGFSRKTARNTDGSTFKVYVYKNTSYSDLDNANGRPGLKQLAGSEHSVEYVMDEKEQQNLLGNW